MPGRIRAKWRPSLALILGATLAAVLCLPLAGIVAVRYLFPLTGYQEAVILVSFGVVVMAGGVGWMLRRILLRPITALAGRADGIVAGDEGALGPLPHYGTREMEHLGQAMLDMGRVLRGREAVLRSYADHATHELKSPLTVLRGAAELMADEDLGAEDRGLMLSRVLGAADRMTDLLEAQRALARAQEPRPAGRSPLGPLIGPLGKAHPEVRIVLAADATLPLSAEGLRLVLDHLLANAAAHGATQVTLTAEADRLSVVDDGPGVSEGNRARIFDPFFTTRREGGGTGMGLPIVRRMLEAHGAEITLAPEGPGARFEIRF